MNKYRNALLCASLLSLLGCTSKNGADDSDSANAAQFGGSCALRVTNGAQCSSGRGPIALLILLDASGTPLGTCTGAFVSTQHILTGAHCFDHGVSSALIQIEGDTVASSAVARPRSYDASNSVSGSDFAVVTIERALSDVETLPLLISEQVSLGQTINIIGFGLDEDGNSALQGNEFNEALKKGTMIVSDVSVTSGEGAFAAEFDSTGQSVCSGDSGGPAIVLNKDGLPGIVGVAQAVADPSSSGSPVCLRGTIAVFTDVQASSNAAFIRSATGGVGEI